MWEHFDYLPELENEEQRAQYCAAVSHGSKWVLAFIVPFYGFILFFFN